VIFTILARPPFCLLCCAAVTVTTVLFGKY
ncbi:MAG: hypothetical protein ACI9PN_000526, partial [Candidatus Azotimanducaceae bacterium]